MSPIENVLSRLDGVRQTGPGRWIARTPTRVDRNPSLSIREGDDGRVLIHEFGGDSVEAICDAIGLSIRDLFPSRPAHEVGSYAREGRIPASDALRCLVSEATILCLAAEQLGRGERLNSEDQDRLSIAASRIRVAAKEVAL